MDKNCQILTVKDINEFLHDIEFQLNQGRNKFMTKKELAKKIAKNAGLTQTQASKCLSAVLDCISDALQQGDKVALPRFGTFSVSNRAERQGKNPSTGESITIPASKIPKFKAGSILKSQVNQ